MQADKNEVHAVKAGERHRSGVHANTYIPHVFLNRSYKRSILDDNPIDGIMQTPQVSQITIQGPLKATRPTDTPSRRKILLCSPSSASGELPCAKTILTTLARKAYRARYGSRHFGPPELYRAGRERRNEDGIERAFLCWLIRNLCSAAKQLSRRKPGKRIASAI